jgi:hypothetical protein
MFKNLKELQMRPKPDLIGQTFGRLTVISETNRNKHNHIQWLCLCSCGKNTIASTTSLKHQNTTSCGCYGNECRTINTRTHGMRHTKIYTVWCNIISRCYDSNHKSWENYGGRGIIVCDQWIKSFESFFTDMGDIPFKNAQIDRINNNGNYEPSNCRWATAKQNCLNRSSTHFITHNGITLALTQWADKYNLARNTLYNRLKKGMDMELALTTKPLQTRKNTKRVAAEIF